MYSDVEVVYCQPDQVYRKAEGQSQSHLKSILKSPAHYVAAGRNMLIPSAPMIMGTAVHCLTLEGKRAFDEQFCRRPPGIKFTTKEGKEWRAANSKKTILTNDDRHRQWDSVIGMSKSLQTLDWFDPNQKDYRKFNEVSIYWAANDIKCKARLDRVIETEDEVLVLDLKTTDSISTAKFQSKLVDLGYDFQAAWYSLAASLVYKKPARFVFVAIERSDPHAMEFFEVPKFMIENANERATKALDSLKNCIEKDEWPARQPSLKLLDYPRWYNSFSRNDQPAPSKANDTFVPLF